MKVGIVTFHKEFNIGASLQSFALMNFINDKICEAEIIDFFKNGIPRKKSLFRLICHYVRTCLHPVSSFAQCRLKRSFEQFWNENYKLSEKEYYGDEEFSKANLNYDYLISGSDQILNMSLTNDSWSFYLPYVQKSKKISYASSFGKESITEKETEAVKKSFPSFVGLSVRESSAQKIVDRCIGKKPVLVLDPVFLLDCTSWIRYEQAEKKYSFKYIFVYAMEFSEILESTIERVSEMCGLPVLVKVGGPSAKRLKFPKVDCGPKQFLSFVHDAEIVISNSFHGIALSMILDKRIYAVSHSTRNTRIENLMNLAGMSKLLISSPKTINGMEFRGGDAVVNLGPFIETSKQYLYDQLK